MPAVLKSFLEQVLRPGFAVEHQTNADQMPRRLLTGKSARIIVTMGMPGLIYDWFYGAHSLKSLERNILGFVGIKPIRHSLIGLVEQPGARHEKWLGKMDRWGADLR